MAHLEGVIRTGPLGLQKKKGVEARFFVLYEDRLDYYTTEEDWKSEGQPRGRLALEDVLNLEVLDDCESFTLALKQGQSLALTPIPGSEVKAWVVDLKPLLKSIPPPQEPKQSVVKIKSVASEREFAATEDPRVSVSTNVFKGFLSTERKGKVTRNFFVLTTKSLDRYEEPADIDLKEPRGRMPMAEVERFEVLQNGFAIVVRGEKRAIELQADDEDRDKWLSHFERLLKERLGRDFVALGANGNQEAAAHESNIAEVADVPKDAPLPESDDIKCQGILTILKKKGDEDRYWVLYADHFEYFNQEEDFQTGRQPRGRADLRDIDTFEESASGNLVLTLAERKFELRASSSKDSQRWAEAWRKAIAKVKAADSTPKTFTPTPDAKTSQGVLIEGMLQVTSGKRTDARYLKLYSDRILFFRDASHSSSGDEPRAKVALKDVSGVQDAPDSVKIRIEDNSISLFLDVPQGQQWRQHLLSLLIDRIEKPEAKAGKGKKIICAGRFTMTIEDGSKSAPSSVHLTLNEDGLRYFLGDLSNVNSRPADGFVSTQDIEDLEVEDNGFIVHLKDGRNLVLNNPIGLSMEDWLQHFGEVFEEDPPATNAAPTGPLRQMPGEIAEEQSPRQLRYDYPENSVRIHDGPVETVFNTNPEKRYGMLRSDRFELFLAPADAGKRAPQKKVLIDNIQSLQVLQAGFEIRAFRGDVRMLRILVKTDFGSWLRGWNEVLGSDFFSSAGVWQRKQGNESSIGMSTDLNRHVIHKGPLKLLRRGHAEVRYFLVYNDRFEHFSDAASAVRGVGFGGRVWAADVRSVRVVDHGFCFGLDGESLDVRVPQGEDMEPWVAAFKGLFERQHSAMEAMEVLDAPTPLLSRNRPFLNQKEGGAARLGADVYDEANDVHVLMWLKQLMAREDVAPVYHGVLGFQHQGRMQARFSILFKDRLDSWARPFQASNGAKADGSITLSEVRGLETISGGFILNVGGRKLGVHVGDNESLHAWSSALLKALAPSSNSVPPQKTLQTSASGLSVGSSPIRGRSLEPASPRSPKPKNWVPRVAGLGTRSSMAERRRSVRITVFTRRAKATEGKFGPFNVNTHKDGMKAAELIHGSKARILLSSSRSGHKEYLNTEISDKINQRSASLPVFDAVADKVTGHERSITPRGVGYVNFFKITADEAPTTPKGVTTPRGVPQSMLPPSPIATKIGAAQDYTSPRRTSSVGASSRLTEKVGAGGSRQPLEITMKRSSSQPTVGKITDDGREGAGWVSPRRHLSMADKVKSLADHAKDLVQRKAPQKSSPTSF